MKPTWPSDAICTSIPRTVWSRTHLEADWNEKLRGLTKAQEEYEQQRQQDRVTVDEQQRARIAAQASDFPRLWQDPKTPDRERMVRLPWNTKFSWVIWA